MHVSMNHVLDATADYFGMPRGALASTVRTHDVTRARHAAMLAAKLLGHFPAHIARTFHKDQSAVAYGIGRASADPELTAAALRIAEAARHKAEDWVRAIPFRHRPTFCIDTPTGTA